MKKSDADAVVAYVEGVTRVAYSGSTYDQEAMRFKAKVTDTYPSGEVAPPVPGPSAAHIVELQRVAQAAWQLIYQGEGSCLTRMDKLRAALVTLDRTT